MDVRKNGQPAELELGAWYVGYNSLSCTLQGAGEIAQYVGDGEFYDEGAETPTDFDDYEHIEFSHAGKL